MKKKIAILLSCVCIAFPALTYAQSNIQVKLDGSYVKFSGQEPTVIKSREAMPSTFRYCILSGRRGRRHSNEGNCCTIRWVMGSSAIFII